MNLNYLLILRSQDNRRVQSNQQDHAIISLVMENKEKATSTSTLGLTLTL
jgi:hypothetical protein